MIQERDPTPLYLQIKEDIAQKNWPPGSKLPSLRVLSEQYEVSVETVRLALLELVAEGKLYRRWGKGIFAASSPKPSKREKSSTSKTIGVVFPQLPLFQQVHAGICQVAQEKGYETMLIYRHLDTTEYQQALETLKSAGIENMIVTPPKVGEDIEGFLKMNKGHSNFVLVDTPIKGMNLDYVATDHFSGAYKAVNHLVKMGHKRISYLSFVGAKHFRDEQRMEGYRKALKDARIKFDKSLILRISTFANRPEDTGALEKYLSSPKRPSAIFAFFDVLAIKAFETIRSMGLKVPQDIALVGYDNSPQARELEVPLSSVDQKAEKMGRMAAEIIIDRMENGKESKKKRIVLEPKLIVRESSEFKT